MAGRLVAELEATGLALFGESKFQAAQYVWERALMITQTDSSLTEQSLNLSTLLRGVTKKLLTPDDHQPVAASGMIKFEDIIGAEREKEEISREFMRHHKYPHLYVQGKAMLLYGPPGTGKTLIAKGIASAFNDSNVYSGTVHVFAASGADLKGKYYGETEKNIKAWFTAAQAMATKNKSVSILFLDEFESLAPNRQGPMASSAGSSSLTALLQFIDGVAGFDKVILLAATNGPWELDSAVLRRFTSKLFVDLPSDNTRALLINKLIRTRLNIPLLVDHNLDAFVISLARLMGASAAIATCAPVDAYLMQTNRTTRDGVHVLGYSLSDVTHAVNSALNKLAERIISQETSYGDTTCYFEPPVICSDCKTCIHMNNGSDLYITLDDLRKHGGPIFIETVNSYPSSINLLEYERFVRYYKDPNQFDSSTSECQPPKKQRVRRKTPQSTVQK